MTLSGIAARAVVKNKSQLRMLGVGGKRSKKNASTPVSNTPVAPQAPTTPIAQLSQGTPTADATKVA